MVPKAYSRRKMIEVLVEEDSYFHDERWAVKIERPGLPNLHRVDAKLYRSAQPTAEELK